MVRDWYQPHLERIYEHVHTRIGDLDQLEQLVDSVPVARALHHRADARSAARHQRSGRHADAG